MILKNNFSRGLLALALVITAAAGLAARNPQPESGWRALNEQRYEDALKEAQVVLSSKPDNEEANWLAAEATLALGDTTGSLKFWNAVVAEEPTHPKAVMRIVEISIATKDLARAQAVLNSALENADRNKDRPEYLYSKGLLLAAQGNDDAMVSLTQAIMKNPREPLFYIALGKVYESKKILALAKDNYLKGLELDSSNAAWHYELADIYFALKDYNTALIQYKSTKALDPNYPNVNYQIGKLYFYAGKYDQAIQELQAAQSKGKESNFFFCTIYGQSLRATKKLPEAQEYLEKAYAQKSTDLTTARALALNSFDLKKFPRAAEVLRQIIALPEAEAGDFSKLGESYYNMAGKDSAVRAYYDSAAVYLKKGMDLNPENSRLAYLIGMTYYAADQYDSALVYFNKKAAMDSTYLPVYINLGYSYLKKENYHEAVRVLRRATQLDSSKVSIHMMLAQSLNFLDSTNAARAEYRKIISIDSTQGDAYGYLGFIYVQEAAAIQNKDKVTADERKRAKELWSIAAGYLRKATQLIPANASYWVAYGQASYYTENYDSAKSAFNSALKYDPRNKSAQEGLAVVEKAQKRKQP
jgi:tetratricopeptide (TPR) repeat protein